jgi:hypothetical protein
VIVYAHRPHINFGGCPLSISRSLPSFVSPLLSYILTDSGLQAPWIGKLKIEIEKSIWRTDEITRISLYLLIYYSNIQVSYIHIQNVMEYIYSILRGENSIKLLKKSDSINYYLLVNLASVLIES